MGLGLRVCTVVLRTYIGSGSLTADRNALAKHVDRIFGLRLMGWLLEVEALRIRVEVEV